MRIVTKNEEETKTLAFSLAKTLEAGDILALFGDLGSGKTTFVKGLAHGLGIELPVTSPTFVISKVYQIVGHGGVERLVHIDAYRLSGPADFDSIGGAELVSAPGTVSVIEWPEIIIEAVPKDRVKIFKFKYKDENQREIEYEV